MNRLARVAVTAMLAGCAGEQAGAVVVVPPPPPATSTSPTTSEPRPRKPRHAVVAKDEKACCAGKNECKGKGGCATGKNACAGKNDCKGQGGPRSGECE